MKPAKHILQGHLWHFSRCTTHSAALEDLARPTRMSLVKLEGKVPRDADINRILKDILRQHVREIKQIEGALRR